MCKHIIQDLTLIYSSGNKQPFEKECIKDILSVIKLLINSLRGDINS